MVTTKYYRGEDYTPVTVLRRVNYVDEAFVKGVWRSTDSIAEWMIGDNNLVDPISESDARKEFPSAFVT